MFKLALLALVGMVVAKRGPTTYYNTNDGSFSSNVSSGAVLINKDVLKEIRFLGFSDNECSFSMVHAAQFKAAANIFSECRENGYSNLSQGGSNSKCDGQAQVVLAVTIDGSKPTADVLPCSLTFVKKYLAYKANQ